MSLGWYYFRVSTLGEVFTYEEDWKNDKKIFMCHEEERKAGCC